MTDRYERLLKLDNDKLIDVVKNYRQYGYDDQFRVDAINILAGRGITTDQLKITGNYDNRTYDCANDLFTSFLKNSKIAFVLYMIFLSTRMIFPMLSNESEGLSILVSIVTIFAFILYFIFLIKSFMNQTQFYKAIGQDYGTDGALLYLFIGMPFYIFMYFSFRNQMKEKMKEIR